MYYGPLTDCSNIFSEIARRSDDSGEYGAKYIEFVSYIASCMKNGI